MKKIIKPFVCTIVMLIIILSTSISVMAKGDDQRVFDDAELFTESEIEELEDRIEELRDEYDDYDFVILTINEYVAIDPVDYAEQFYFNKENDFRPKGYMLLINMNSREVTVSAMGDAQYEMDASDNQMSRDNIVPKLKSKKYFKAGQIFLSDMEDCISKGKITKYHELTIVEIIVAIVIPVIVFVVFVSVVKKKYGTEGKAQPYPFKERGSVKLTHRDDKFIREYVTHVKIESSSSGSGGGGGSSYHSSSSGGSSGGTSKF